MDNEENKVIFTTDDNEEVVFHIIEQTKVSGCNYLLVTDGKEEDEEVNAYILKDKSKETDEAAAYEMVEEEQELELIAKVFEELLEDIEFETE